MIMSESSLITISLAVLFLPLVGFTIVLLLGKRYEKLYWVEIGIIALTLLLSIFIGFIKLGSYVHQDIVAAFTWIDFGNVPSIGELSVKL